MATTLNVCSFNCKSIKTSVTELNDLCTNHDFVLLRETWLSRPELPMLSQINSSFTGYGIYSMDEESQILSGRPFGGIAIPYGKVTCFPHVNPVCFTWEHIKAHIFHFFFSKCHKLSHVIHMYITNFHSGIPCVTKFHMKYAYMHINSTQQDLHVDACGKKMDTQQKIHS